MFVQGNTVIDENVDTWGVGLIAYQLLNGPIKDLKLYGDKFSFMSERKVEAFGSDGDSRMLTSSVQTDGTQGIGISSTDKLINSLLMPDPTQRVSLEDALKTSLFQDERLDSPEMSNLLKKFSTLPRLPEDSPDQERAEAFAQHIEPELRQLGLL